MKKVLSLLLAALCVVLSLAVFPASAEDNGDMLTITEDGRTLAQVKVGSVFLYSVGLCAGDFKLLSGAGEVKYDGSLVTPVPYGPLRSDGSVNWEAYSFPSRLYNANMVANLDLENEIQYNFARANGVEAFNDVNMHYFKLRFKAIAPGTAEIRHRIRSLYTRIDGETVRVWREYAVNHQLDPLPYYVSSAEPAAGLIGDADGDCDVTVMDASFIQYLTAGRIADFSALTADVNADGEINLRDALEILRHKAGMTASESIGEWVFESEK